MSGSNCCDPEVIHLFLRKPDGTFGARREIRFERPDIPVKFLARGKTRPYLLDWNRDGHTDLVIGYPLNWTVHVAAGPLAGKTEVKVEPFALPSDPGGSPMHFAFADWDDDGKFDALVAVQKAEGKGENDRLRYSYSIYWYRNTTARGEPKFGAANRLLTIPAPWALEAFSVVDWDQDGCLDLVVSVSKSFGRESQLWLYRRKG